MHPGGGKNFVINGLKRIINTLKCEKLQLRYGDTQKYFFSQRVVNKWNSLPDNVKSHQLFNLFKNNLDNFLSET